MAQAPAGQGNAGGSGGFMGNLADFFRPKNPPQQQQTPQGQQQQPKLGPDGKPLPVQGQQGQQGQQQGPSGGTPSGANNNPDSFQNPLDVYKDLFNNSGTPQGAEAPKFSLAPDMVGKAASSIDFLQGLPDEVQQKVAAGQIDGPTLTTLLNHVAQQTYANVMHHSSALTDKFVGMRLGHESQGLNTKFKNFLANNKVLSNPKIANNPIIKSQMERITTELAGKYPDQSDAWIAEQAQAYFMEMAKALNPEAFTQQGSGGQGGGANDTEFDFEAYLNNKRQTPQQ